MRRRPRPSTPTTTTITEARHPSAVSLWVSPASVWDLAGNVKEWCLDEYHPYPGGAPMLDFDATTPDLDWIQEAALRRELYCVRGGGWSKQPANLRSTYRDADGAGRWFFSLGFRTVKFAD
ncbi:MAG: SUMF1/EgtB/PvdO family nonheme iron enzyme [Candidatus Latescibacterota bacterium]